VYDLDEALGVVGSQYLGDPAAAAGKAAAVARQASAESTQ